LVVVTIASLGAFGPEAFASWAAFMAAVGTAALNYVGYLLVSELIKYIVVAIAGENSTLALIVGAALAIGYIYFTGDFSSLQKTFLELSKMFVGVVDVISTVTTVYLEEGYAELDKYQKEIDTILERTTTIEQIYKDTFAGIGIDPDALLNTHTRGNFLQPVVPEDYINLHTTKIESQYAVAFPYDNLQENIFNPGTTFS